VALVLDFFARPAESLYILVTVLGWSAGGGGSGPRADGGRSLLQSLSPTTLSDLEDRMDNDMRLYQSALEKLDVVRGLYG